MTNTDWDVYASSYDLEPDHGLADVLVRNKWKELVSSAIPSKPMRVIDMGGGTGSISELLAEAGHAVTYIDSSPEMTKFAKEKCQRFGKQIDYFTYPVEDATKVVGRSSFDVVFGRHILWTTENLAETLKTWHSLLNDRGYFVLVEGFWSTGAGISSGVLERAVRKEMGSASATPLNDPLYWGKEITDERYLILSK